MTRLYLTVTAATLHGTKRWAKHFAQHSSVNYCDEEPSID